MLGLRPPKHKYKSESVEERDSQIVSSKNVCSRAKAHRLPKDMHNTYHSMEMVDIVHPKIDMTMLSGAEVCNLHIKMDKVIVSMAIARPRNQICSANGMPLYE